MTKLTGNDEGIQYICKLICEAYEAPVLWLDDAAMPRLVLGPSTVDRPTVQGTGGLPVEVIGLAVESRCDGHDAGSGASALPVCTRPASWRTSLFSRFPMQAGPSSWAPF